jgi:hypothetical protein
VAPKRVAPVAPVAPGAGIAPRGRKKGKRR